MSKHIVITEDQYYVLLNALADVVDRLDDTEAMAIFGITISRLEEIWDDIRKLDPRRLNMPESRGK